MSSPTSSYWCYRCARFVHVSTTTTTITCPYCDSGFIEQIESPDNNHSPLFTPPAAMFMITNNHHNNRQDSDLLSSLRFRRNRRNRLPFNPVIVLRGGASNATTSFDLYYDDGSGSGLRPLPEPMSEFLMGSGFDRVIEQLFNPDITGLLGRPENPAASKAAVESMPTLEIVESHVRSEFECAICKEEFELGSLAREMPCKHIYHGDCIVPWLSTRNTCPLCRHEMPAAADSDRSGDNDGNEEERVGMAIWRLPGGGFAVGRRGGGERELPVVFTEMDGGGYGESGGGSRFSWVTSRRQRERGGGGGGFRRVLTSLVSLFRRPNPQSGHIHSTRSLFNRYLQRQNTSANLVLD